MSIYKTLICLISGGGGKPREDPKKEKGKQKPVEKQAKKMKKRQREKSTSSSSGGESEQEASSSSSEEESSSSGSKTESSSSEEERQPKKKRARKQGIDWTKMEELWPMENRPELLKKKSFLKTLTVDQFFMFKKNHMEEVEKLGIGNIDYGKDKRPKEKKYKAEKDDCWSKLHKIRFKGLPYSKPRKYWKKVAKVQEPTYRHIALDHVGAEGTPEKTIVKMHNRMVAVELGMMIRENIMDMKQAKMAMLNYVAVLRSLHPLDYSGLSILRVLEEADWASGQGGDEKKRTGLVKKFFDDCARENAGKAVRGETPMTYEQVGSLAMLNQIRYQCEAQVPGNGTGTGKRYRYRQQYRCGRPV